MTKFRLYHFAFIFLLILISTETFAQIELLNFEDLNEPTSQPEQESKPKITETALNSDDLIHFGDLIEVDIIGSNEYDWRGRITNEGFLDGIEFTDDEIYGLCKTGDEVATEIAKSYGKFLKNPQIFVSILDRSNRPVSTLYGAVGKPQKFKIKRKVYLNELIILSGGFTEKASGVIQILRQPNSSCITKIENDNKIAAEKKILKEEFIKVKQENVSKYIDIKISDLLTGKRESNLEILYGDIITVKIAEPVYIIGGVVNPTKIPIREKTTVSRAIDSAGGLTNSADLEKIIIFRRVSGNTIIIKINLKDIAEGNADDVELKAYDIVDVTEKGRDEKKYPPIISNEDLKENNLTKLPVTIIN